MTDDLATRFKHFLAALVFCDAKAVAAFGSTYVEAKAALNTQTGAQGGYTVPEEFIPRLLRPTESSVIRPRAVVVRMKADTARIPAPNLRTAPTSTSTTARFGGLVPVWTEETALQNAETTLRQLTLTAREHGGLCRASQALHDDTEAAGSDVLLFNHFADAIAWHQDYAFLRGTGADDNGKDGDIPF